MHYAYNFFTDCSFKVDLLSYGWCAIHSVVPPITNFNSGAGTWVRMQCTWGDNHTDLFFSLTLVGLE